MTFWIIVIAAAVLIAAIIARPLLRGTSSAAPRAAHDAQVFRDQLKELDKDVARGTVNEAEADGARLEIQRRLLAADGEMQATHGQGSAPRNASRVLAAVLIIATPVAAAFLYNDIGSPGTKDQPLASRSSDDRPDQEAAEQMLAGEQFSPPAGPDADQFRSLVTQLETRLENNPDDPQGVFLYARSLMQLGRFGDAWPQFARAIELNPDIGMEARAGMAEGMILATGGYISPEAEDALLELLKFEPTNPSGRYYLGRLHVQSSQPAFARAIWSQLLEDSPADAPWVRPVQAELAQIGGAAPASRPAAAPALDEGLRGPSAEELAAAEDLSTDDRADMVNTMVSGLANRIAAEGGSVQEWTQLIRSYQVLKQFDDAAQARADAIAAYQDDAEAVAHLQGLPRHPDEPVIEPETANTPAPGPTQEQVEAAQEMDPDDRQSMIQGMVSRLAARLNEEGGSADEWLRLISSYNVMGQQDKAQATYEQAKAALAGQQTQLDLLVTAIEGTPPEPLVETAPTSPGPTQEDIAAAAEMDPDDRQDMIRGMVSRLHNKLAEDGRVGDVNEWGKLFRSYSVLNDNEALLAAYEEARGIYDDDAISLAYLKEAALLAGAQLN
ncbi:MAG: c-type cytochrome biogenesis protein CcmI [Pikeienuella sp.]